MTQTASVTARPPSQLVVAGLRPADQKHSYPFIYPLENNIYLHIEQIDKHISCIWFGQRDEVPQQLTSKVTESPEKFGQENPVLYSLKLLSSKITEASEIPHNIPEEFSVYDSDKKLVNPFRNTQSYALSRHGYYTLMYQGKPLIKLSTIVLCSIPPIIKNQITVVLDDDSDSDSADDNHSDDKN